MNDEQKREKSITDYILGYVPSAMYGLANERIVSNVTEYVFYENGEHTDADVVLVSADGRWLGSANFKLGDVEVRDVSAARQIADAYESEIKAIEAEKDKLDIEKNTSFFSFGFLPFCVVASFLIYRAGSDSCFLTASFCFFLWTFNRLIYRIWFSWNADSRRFMALKALLKLIRDARNEAAVNASPMKAITVR